jgi:hypothetical protein
MLKLNAWKVMLILLLGAMGPTMVSAQQGGGGGGRFGDPQQFIDNNDTNKDGKVSADEFQGPSQLFERMDGNSDGFVTSEEVTAARAQFAQGGGQGGGGGRGQNAGQGGGRGGRGGGRIGFLRQQMGSTDEEWAVLEPRVQKVLDVQAAVRPAFGGFGGFGGRGGRGGGGGGAGNRGGGGGGGVDRLPEVEKLSEVLQNENATNDEITAALKSYREAIKKNDEALKTAREELRKVVTVRQEAALVMGSILD